jgi:hypothetical protein
MKAEKNTRKIWVAVFIVALFLISSMMPVDAGMLVDQSAQSTPLQSQTITTTSPFYYHNKYAVIIIGAFGDVQHYKWFSNDAQRQYNLATQKLGFNSDNVYVLFTFSDNESWVPDPSFNPSIVDCAATEENIKTVFNDLKNKMDPHGYDLLYVVVIAHGIDLGWYYGSLLHKKFPWWPEGDIFPNGHDTYFGVTKPTDGSDAQELEIEYNYSAGDYYCNQSAQSAQIVQSIQSSYVDNSSKIDDKVFDYELNDYTRDVPARRIIFVLNPCMSGGFINDLSGKNRVIITASKEDELANAPFIGYFYYGLNGDADNNGDGRISLAEVFDYTSNKVKEWLINRPEETPEHPLLDDNGDRAGHNIAESDYDPTTEGKDDYVSARIYDLSYEEINYPPEKPTITGPSGGKPGTSYNYTFNAVDSNGDQVKYLIDWGDGNTVTTDLNPSNTDVKVSHTWNAKGTYTIKAKAKDVYNAESDWETLSVSMPRGKILPNQLFLQFLQNHPHMFPILRHLMGL